MSTCTCPANRWYLALEMERNAKYIPPTVTYVHVTELPENDGVNPRSRKKYAPRLTEAEQKKRDKDFYDAGRFAAGARDDDAIQAMDKLTKLQTKGKL